MKKFGKLLSRRLGRDSPPPSPVPSSASTPEFHQLSSRRRGPGGDDIITSKRLPRAGTGSHIIADGSGTGSLDNATDDSRAPLVCDRCADIDFPRLLDWKPGDPRPWVSLLHTLSDSDCPFCTFFQAMIGADSDDVTGKFTPYLRIRLAFERMGGLGERHELGHQVLIEVTTKHKTLPWGYVLSATKDEHMVDGYLSISPQIRGRTVTPLLDPTVPRAWLSFCNDNHGGEACGETTDGPVENLKLIDCDRACIVSENECGPDGVDYVALSYVRGTVLGPPSSCAASELPKIVPKLIEDAISFTRALGFRYLWVDRYCFAPSDMAQRRQQLDKMGEIYARAALTLVVAAGDGVEQGIPGISLPREEQLSLKTERGLYTTSLLRPDIEIGRSTWASRGWTYQEGLLSRRRLVFTPSQVYFQCRCLHCHESISLPLCMASSVQLGRVFPDTGPLWRSGQVKEHIKAYLGKGFTDKTDRLDAFRGVLHRYLQMDLAVENFLALPLFDPKDFKISKVVSQTDRLAVALGWVLDRLTASEDADFSYRLAGSFPSWTWLAWQPKHGQSKAGHSFYFNLVGDTSPLIDGVSAPPEMEISVGFEDQLVVSWEIDGEAIAKRTEKIAFLRLATFCVDIKVQKTDDRLALVQPSGIPEAGKRAIEVWASSEMDTGSEGDETAEHSPANGEYNLTGMLLSGRNWTDADDASCAATILICRRRTWEADGQLVRLGALGISYACFLKIDDRNAVMKGVQGSGTDLGERGDLDLELRELDLY